MRRRGATVAAIDVGSTKVAVVVGDLDHEGDLRITGYGVAPASGLSRGVIDNLQSAREAIEIAVKKAEQSSGLRIFNAVVGISGGHISSQNHRGIIAIPNRARPISEDDRDRVLEVAGNIAIPGNRQVLHVLPRGYWIEGTEPVSDPVGMYGSRLDAEAHIVTGALSAIQNLRQCVEAAGVHADEVVVESVAASLSAMHPDEREQGAVLVDIGGSNTSLAVYDEGAIAHTACLPLAGSHMTKDLAQMLRCPWEAAEHLKVTYGSALPGAALDRDTVEIESFGTSARKSVKLSFVAEVLQARCEEILDAVVVELKRTGYLDRLAAGIVFTGGASELRNFAEFAEQRLGLPARVGRPTSYSGLSDLIATPAYATVVGLIEHAVQGPAVAVEGPAPSYPSATGSLWQKLAAVGRALRP
ncbi:MAG: cell division protein FtsA [Dehalococcoidia bacterium]